MSHKYYSGAVGGPDLQKKLLHLTTCLCVERSKRLVKEKYFWVRGERAGKSQALPHTSGEGRGVGGFKARQSDCFNPRPDRFAAFRWGDS